MTGFAPRITIMTALTKDHHHSMKLGHNDLIDYVIVRWLGKISTNSRIMCLQNSPNFWFSASFFSTDVIEIVVSVVCRKNLCLHIQRATLVSEWMIEKMSECVCESESEWVIEVKGGL